MFLLKGDICFALQNNKFDTNEREFQNIDLLGYSKKRINQ